MPPTKIDQRKQEGLYLYYSKEGYKVYNCCTKLSFKDKKEVCTTIVRKNKKLSS